MVLEPTPHVSPLALSLPPVCVFITILPSVDQHETILFEIVTSFQAISMFRQPPENMLLWQHMNDRKMDRSLLNLQLFDT